MTFELKNTAEFDEWLNMQHRKEQLYKRRVLATVGLNGVNYIRANWSPASPSSPGSPPAVVSGNLSNSLGYTVDDDQVMLTASAIYAEYLEFGTIHMDKRPYFQLAFEYLKNKFPEFAADIGFE